MIDTLLRKFTACRAAAPTTVGLPVIQRPFIWENAKVRNLFDSMYHCCLDVVNPTRVGNDCSAALKHVVDLRLWAGAPIRGRQMQWFGHKLAGATHERPRFLGADFLS